MARNFSEAQQNYITAKANCDAAYDIALTEESEEINDTLDMAIANRVIAENALIDWAINIARSLPKFKANAELIESAVTTKNTIYRKRIIDLCMKLNAS